jgi:hypothetical protein
MIEDNVKKKNIVWVDYNKISALVNPMVKSELDYDRQI